MPRLTPCLLTTHDIYSMNRDIFRSALRVCKTQPSSRLPRPTGHMADWSKVATWKIPIWSHRGHQAIASNPFSGCHCPPCCWTGPRARCHLHNLPAGCWWWSSCAWHGRPLNTAPPVYLDSADFSLTGEAGSCSTHFIHSTHQKLFCLPLTAFTVAVRLYDAMHSMHSKSILVFIAKSSVKNG